MRYSKEVKSAGQRRANRAPRVRLAGAVLTLILLENGRQLRGRLHALSSTGGLLHVENPLDEGIKVELIFHVRKTTTRGKARMLFPMWATQGCLQPFRFDGLAEEDLRRLQASVEGMLGLAGDPPAMKTPDPGMELPTETAN
jgi:hypothetical protein